jgi:hypothetical protein
VSLPYPQLRTSSSSSKRCRDLGAVAQRLPFLSSCTLVHNLVCVIFGRRLKTRARPKEQLLSSQTSTAAISSIGHVGYLRRQDILNERPAAFVQFVNRCQHKQGTFIPQSQGFASLPRAPPIREPPRFATPSQAYAWAVLRAVTHIGHVSFDNVRKLALS